jgi:addiction module HigA family antidote
MAMKKSKTQIPLTHPGRHLAEFIDDYGITQYRLAKDLCIQQTRIMEIIKGRRAISADTALRLARYFGTSAEMWLNLQKNYELEVAERAVGNHINENVKPISVDAGKAG